jgi:hypothetical protein
LRHGEKADLPAQIGEVLGGYRLDAVIACGGMGCVYAATHIKLERRVAIKVLLESLAKDAAYVERFFHEARIVNEVRHPNIIDIYDFIETDSPRRVAYVMEHLSGQTLREHLSLGPLTETQAANIAMQLASALEAVHQVGVVHRDLKPANIVIVGSIDSDLDTVPSIKLLDFGVAKRPDWLAKGTAPGKVVGTPAYMSPEQIDGVVGPAIDVYALGAILYEMLKGERLFPGDPRSVLMSKIDDTPRPIHLPRDLYAADRFTALIRICTDPHPDHRASLDTVMEALEQLVRELARPTRALVLVGKKEEAASEETTLPPELSEAIDRKPSGRTFVVLALAAFALALAAYQWARDDLALLIEQRSAPGIVETTPIEEPQAAPDPKPLIAEHAVDEKRPVEKAREVEVAREVEAAREVEEPREVEEAREHKRTPRRESRRHRPAPERTPEPEPAPAPDPDALRKDDILPW